ncbi:hypothetical protein BRAS3843_870002 [Bradyrhizobium sp. STM 3843]|nr:hypothetical protein BRAS3843_870002 [Bradyrhizobium sp. STM 3843]
MRAAIPQSLVGKLADDPPHLALVRVAPPCCSYIRRESSIDPADLWAGQRTKAGDDSDAINPTGAQTR